MRKKDERSIKPGAIWPDDGRHLKVFVKPTYTDLFIRRAYDHKGIKIAVDIDLEKKRVSLVEPTGSGDYRRKKWLFSERELKYMAGWQLILDAMKFAIGEASAVLEEAEARDNKKFQDLMLALAIEDLDHLPKLPNKKGGSK